jgi:hypothetical protein
MDLRSFMRISDPVKVQVLTSTNDIVIIRGWAIQGVFDFRGLLHNYFDTEWSPDHFDTFLNKII